MGNVTHKIVSLLIGASIHARTTEAKIVVFLKKLDLDLKKTSSCKQVAP